MGKIKVKKKGLPSISLALGDRSVSQINGLGTLQKNAEGDVEMQKAVNLTKQEMINDYKYEQNILCPEHRLMVQY